MKRFFENTLISGAYSKALRVVALLCVLLGVSSNATAGAGFWTDDAWDFYWYSGSKDEWKGSSSNDWKWSGGYKTGATVDLGAISGTPYLKGFKARVWKNGGNDIQGVKVTYSGAISGSKDLSWKANYDADGSTNQYWEDTSLNIALPTTVGSHTINLTFSTSGTVNSITATIKYTIAAPAISLPTSQLNGCNKIVIKSKNNYGLYPFKDGKDLTSVTYDNSVNNKGTLKDGFYTWELTSDHAQIIFRNSLGNKTSDSDILYGGYAYIFDKDYTIDKDGTQKPNPSSYEAVDCSGSGPGGDTPSGNCRTLYLEPTNIWNNSGARFAAYFYGGGPAETWVDMVSSSCSGLLKVAVPNTAYTNVIFVRMNGGTTENNWNNKWNQTGDLSLTHTNNLFTITNMGSGSELSSGSWSTNACADKADCSGSGEEEFDECDVVEIWARGKGSYTGMNCNVGSATAVSTGIKSYNGANYATWKVTTKTSISVKFCAEATYCTNSANMEPGNRYICEFAADNWGNQDYTIVVTEALDCAGEQTDVLLSKQPIVNKATKKATLYGYLKNNSGCYPITDYGFYYCFVVDGEKCKPSAASSNKLAVDPSHQLVRSEEFSAELELMDGYTYYYRAYAVINDVPVLSQETRMISTDPCVQQVCCGAPVVYTINADPSFQENLCKLHFNSLQDAIDHLKNSSYRTDAYQYAEEVGSSYNLKQPVVMNVVYYDDDPTDNTSAYTYRGTTNVGKRAGDAMPKNSNLIEDINRTATNAANTLTIKAGTKTAKPWIHHIVLRNSKNIVLDSLCIYSDPVLYDGKTIGDNAIEMDINHANGSDNWNQLNSRTGDGLDDKGFLSNANILVQNCMIGSDGFTGAHISSMDGITFKNNDFEIVAGANMNKNYGASFKLLYCKNVKFIENNFRGDHATLMWIQEVNNMLVMNNVFWNTNKLVIDKEGDQYPAAMRLVTQFSNSIANVGFFYNTYYFAENNLTVAVPSGYDFLQMTHTVSGGSGDINVNTIKFQYNNCYSYDSDAHGRTADDYQIKNPDNSSLIQTGPFLGITLPDANFCGNNFWSQYDEDRKYTSSKFAFGCNANNFINVKGQVCETSATGPSSLMINGEGLDYGVKPDIAFTGITLTDEEWYSDRYLSAVRPNTDKGWTYGAYQSKDEIKTNTIYWVGLNDKWDDRNNWEYETRDASGMMVRQRVSCINQLSEDLKVVIEEIGTVEVAGGRKWPKVPASFDAIARKTESGGVPEAEQVNAGNDKFASTIELEYGAGLRGVENLNDNGTLRYDKAIVHFDADRDKWLLVGPIVRPFKNGKDGETRSVNSGDYYKNLEPIVYMHETTIDENGDISWGKTFGDLNIDVNSNTVFAINASLWYGPYFDNAEDYLKYEGIAVDDAALVPYTFTGRFAVEEGKSLGYYTFNGLNDGKNLLNNVYPCNLNAKTIEALADGLGGTINVYNYEQGAFESTSASSASGNVYIKAQNGFVFIPHDNNTNKEFKFTDEILAEGSTRTRSAERVLPSFSLRVDNANTTKPGASNVVVRYDEELDSSMESLLNTPKVFTKNVDTPESYIIHKEGKYTRLDTHKEKVCIPLGVRVQKPMNLTFEKVYNEGYEEVTLVDTKTQKYYNLLERVYTTDVVNVGETEGRFYLNLTVASEEDDDLIEDEEEDNNENTEGDVTTEVDETVEDVDINIYAVDGNTIHVVTIGTSLQTIYVSDMAGRTDSYNVDGNFAELSLPVSQGVYTVNVIADKATKIGKVILK